MKIGEEIYKQQQAEATAKQPRQIFLSIATIIMNDKIRLSIN